MNISSVAHAADWVSVTWDNDMFVGSDDGYTNGLFVSWFDVGLDSKKNPEPTYLVRPLLWSLSGKKPAYTINAQTIAQMMVTPDDITSETPDPDDIPYAGLLLYSNSHLKVYDDFADLIGTTLGVVGPASGAEQTQKFIHERLGSDEPKGWDSQLKNELIFQFARARTWRAWVSDGGRGKTDILLTSDFNVGTIESSVGSSVMFRYGTDLSRSFVTTAFRSNRISNPIAVDGGWYVYFGVGARYYRNLIFVDGNTYRDSPSVDLDSTQTGVSAGISYSWDTASLTLAVEDLTFFEDRYKGIARYGTLTFAWRI
jgi:hypothetical protein